MTELSVTFPPTFVAFPMPTEPVPWLTRRAGRRFVGELMRPTRKSLMRMANRASRFPEWGVTTRWPSAARLGQRVNWGKGLLKFAWSWMLLGF